MLNPKSAYSEEVHPMTSQSDVVLKKFFFESPKVYFLCIDYQESTIPLFSATTPPNGPSNISTVLLVALQLTIIPLLL